MVIYVGFNIIYLYHVYSEGTLSSLKKVYN